MSYLVSPAPHRLTRTSANDMFMYVSIAALSCLSYGFFAYGIKALIVLLTCTLTCVILEFGIQSIKNAKPGISDYSCFVTGLILACVMPINMPWYVGMIAAVIAVFSKYLFGGLGNNIFNPSALARSIVGVMVSGFSFDLYNGETALNSILSGNSANIALNELMLGKTPGAIGTTCIAFILLFAVILIVFKVIRWENVLCAAVGFVIIIWTQMGYESIIPMLCSGSFIFVTVFMLSDPTTSPYGFTTRCIYAFSFGIIAALMMSHNVFGETAVFLALLVANFIAPALDKVFSVFHRGVRKHD